MSSRSDDSLRAFLRHEHGRTPVLRAGEHRQSEARLGLRENRASRMREHLLGNLREAGLSEDQAQAEAERILAGDVWSG